MFICVKGKGRYFLRVNSLIELRYILVGGQSGTVSWDHFFTSMNQYYTELRQEVPVASDMAHIYRHKIRGITQQEIEGLCAVLELTRTIAEQVRDRLLKMLDHMTCKTCLTTAGKPYNYAQCSCL